MTPISEFFFVASGLARFNFWFMRFAYFVTKVCLQVAVSMLLTLLVTSLISYFSAAYNVPKIEKYNRFDIFSDTQESTSEDDDDDNDSDSDYEPEYSDDSETDDDDSDSEYSDDDSDSDYEPEYSDDSDAELIDSVFIDKLNTNDIVALVDKENGTTQTPLFKVVKQMDQDSSKYEIKLHQFKDNNNKVYYGFLANAEPSWWTCEGLYLDLDRSALIDEKTSEVVHEFSLIHTLA